jgi:hypothetical protein
VLGLPNQQINIHELSANPGHPLNSAWMNVLLKGKLEESFIISACVRVLSYSEKSNKIFKLN